MNYDPKLRECMAEVETVLRKYDCAGFVALSSKTHSEFKNMITHMSWSNVRFVKDGTAVHLKIYMKSEKEKTSDTIAAIYSLRDLSALAFGQLEQMANKVEQHAVVEHLPFGGKGINNDDRQEI